MTDAYLQNVSRDAHAKLLTAFGTGTSGATEVPFDTAEQAFAAALDAQGSGKYEMVKVWVEGAGTLDLRQIAELLDYWRENPA
jgi:hypothetical protein